MYFSSCLLALFQLESKATLISKDQNFAYPNYSLLMEYKEIFDLYVLILLP